MKKHIKYILFKITWYISATALMPLLLGVASGIYLIERKAGMYEVGSYGLFIKEIILYTYSLSFDDL